MTVTKKVNYLNNKDILKEIQLQPILLQGIMTIHIHVTDLLILVI